MDEAKEELREVIEFLKTPEFSQSVVSALHDNKCGRDSHLCQFGVQDIRLFHGYDAVPVMKTIDPGINIVVTVGANTKALEARVREEDIFYIT